ncbi:hypothetical protein ABW21_db0204408 [Orbilia brochopaga]|nr:hypothetical protein ABW21_db0204408 [Drechslerella brochopaga]
MYYPVVFLPQLLRLIFLLGTTTKAKPINQGVPASLTSTISISSNPSTSQTLTEINPQSKSILTATDHDRSPKPAHDVSDEINAAYEQYLKLNPEETSQNPDYDKRDFLGFPLEVTNSIQCATVRQILFQMDPDPSNYPRYPQHSNVEARNRTDYRPIRVLPASYYRPVRDRLKTRARHWKALCNDCRCLRDTPFVVPNFAPEIILSDDEDDYDPMYELAHQTARRIDAPRCRSWEYATVCRTWYNCRCMYQIRRKPSSNRTNIQADIPILLANLEQTLKNRNKVPLDEKPTFRDYDDEIIGGAAPAVQVHDAFPMSYRRQQVQDTTEPYYLEGPSVSEKGTWDWLTHPLLGIGTAWVAHRIGMDAIANPRKSIFKRSTYKALVTMPQSPLEEQKKCL